MTTLLNLGERFTSIQHKQPADPKQWNQWEFVPSLKPWLPDISVLVSQNSKQFGKQVSGMREWNKQLGLSLDAVQVSPYAAGESVRFLDKRMYNRTGVFFSKKQHTHSSLKILICIHIGRQSANLSMSQYTVAALLDVMHKAAHHAVSIQVCHNYIGMPNTKLYTAYDTMHFISDYLWDTNQNPSIHIKQFIDLVQHNNKQLYFWPLWETTEYTGLPTDHIMEPLSKQHKNTLYKPSAWMTDTYPLQVAKWQEQFLQACQEKSVYGIPIMHPNTLYSTVIDCGNSIASLH
jgi:hypothetical protein